MWQWWTVFLELVFLTPVRVCSIMSDLNLNQQAFIQLLFVPALERVNKELCPDCYLRTMLGDGFVLSQLSLALRLIIVQVYASNDTYHLLPNPWDSLWKASAWNIWPLQLHMCDLCCDSLGRATVGGSNIYSPLHCRVSLTAVKDHALVSAALNTALCCETGCVCLTPTVL